MKLTILSLLLSTLLVFSPTFKQTKIQVALLLDTSSSMNGLIEQTKAQLLQIVGELSEAKKDEEYVIVEIAVLSFGGKDADNTKGYIKILNTLTTDLDAISEQLNFLLVQGSQEYAGWAIQTALDSLLWSENAEDLKFIIIAGNEGFNQGKVDYVEACFKAKEKDIIINTIYCGSYQHGVEGMWKTAADTVGGHYANINQDKTLEALETPYDAKIIDLNTKLIDTYIPYGDGGLEKYKRQLKQDEIAKRYGIPYLRKRAVFKAGRAYKNPSWDVIDAMDEDVRFLKNISKQELPALFENRSLSKMQQYFMKLSMQRELLKETILLYNEKANEFLTIKMGSSPNEPTLEEVVLQAVKAQAVERGFVF